MLAVALIFCFGFLVVLLLEPELVKQSKLFVLTLYFGLGLAIFTLVGNVLF